MSSITLSAFLINFTGKAFDFNCQVRAAGDNFFKYSNYFFITSDIILPSLRRVSITSPSCNSVTERTARPLSSVIE